MIQYPDVDQCKRFLQRLRQGFIGMAGLGHTRRMVMREVVRRALHHNAAGVIFAHNHPSGIAEPSHADEILTQSLKQALVLVDIKVLDHFIVAGGSALSFAERGLI